MAVISTILTTKAPRFPAVAKLINEKKILDRRPQNFDLMR
jgi:hypothetical protein